MIGTGRRMRVAATGTATGGASRTGQGAVGVNVIGMPFGMHGLGQELRDKVRALRAAGIEVAVIEENYSSLGRRVADDEIAALVTDTPRHPVNLICHNLPAIGLIAARRPDLLAGRHNIAAPYWEFPELPERHRDVLGLMDEFWVSNGFLKAVFGAHTDRPVRQLPLHIPAPAARDPRQPGPTTFGYVFDFNSMAARKDPMALVLAFLECFAADPGAEVRLLLKYNMEPSRLVRPRDVEDFLRLCALDPRIEVVGTPLDATAMAALMGRIDVYVSPHRAEGLGRGIIEMMMAGRAVAATDWSGPAEFLDPAHSTPIEAIPSHVGAAALGDIRPDFSWAEPRLGSVMDALRAYAADPALARRHGAGARAALAPLHGPVRHGEAARDRLAELA